MQLERTYDDIERAQDFVGVKFLEPPAVPAGLMLVALPAELLPRMRRVAALLQTLPEHVRNGLLARLGDFFQAGQFQFVAAGHATNGLAFGSLQVEAFRLEELIAAARAAQLESANFHGCPPDAS